jgi:hypothetical protein
VAVAIALEAMGVIVRRDSLFKFEIMLKLFLRLGRLRSKDI